jgi:DNA polymerase III subunit delta
MASTISHAQLNAQLAQGTVAPLYVVVGEEDLLRDMALGALKTALLGEGESDFNCDLFYGDDVSGEEIVTCASEVAVFAARRVVVVKAADKLPARECDAILPYLKEPNDSTAVIFVAPKLDGRFKFTQALARAAVTIDCSPLREAQWLPWLRQDAERVGVRLNAEAIELLKEACGGSLYSVRRELEKLAAYVSPGQAVTAGDVATLRGTEPGASVFDLTLAIGGKNRGRVLAILARNLEAGEAPLRILGSLAWQYRRLWKVKEVVRQGGREGEAARTLRMDPYKVRAFLEQFPDAHLHEALRLFLDADAKLKGGSDGRPARILEDVLLRLCDRAQPNPPPPSTSRGSEVPQPVRARTISNVRTITSGKQTRS